MPHSSFDLENAPPDSAHASDTDDIRDLVMSSDGETCNVFPPPPHVAARFYRKAQTRRKSSAASSRRNSLSSLRSNLSNRSSHGGPQSNHIAQHLRRASIIESRKARLADKAAHAEKVRLRAALAKAAPRASTCSEERVLAAKHARERYLAQVAANCAEEVKRAKKVAEETKEKKAAKHLKLKGNMEERFAEAERRRLLYQQNPRRARATSLPAVEEKVVSVSTWKPRTNEAAARLIQKAWRNRRRRQVIADFMQFDLTVERIQNTSFEDVSGLLSQDAVLASTARMLKLCGLRDGEGGGLGESTASRIFLSTFLILGHPIQVLSSNGEQEQDLTMKAKDVLLAFDQLISKPTLTKSSSSYYSPLPSDLASFSEAFFIFQGAFTAWKNHDSSILVETMLAQFVELEAIWQTVKNDTNGDVAEDYRVGIQHNQTLLLARLKRLAGPEKAKNMIKAAVRANRNSKPKSNPVGHVRPRASSSIQQALPTAAEETQEHASVSAQTSLGADRRVHIAELNKVLLPLPSNRIIIHELAISKEYKIDAVPRLQQRDTITRGVLSSMRSDLEAGLGDRWIASMAESIRDRLLRLVSPGRPMHTLISETLDQTMIENQLKIGSFSYENFFSFMNTILPKLCAPVRDADVKDFAADRSGDFIERLAKVMHIINLMSFDYSNFLLQKSAAQLIEKAAEYEKSCFAKRIGDQKLVKTIRWWGRARAKMIAELNSMRQAEDNPPQVIPTYINHETIYTQGLVDLAIHPDSTNNIEIPETLELDKLRIARWRLITLHMITVGAILLTAKNLLKREVRSQWKAEAQRMGDISFPLQNPPWTNSIPPPPPASIDTVAQAYLAVIESSHVLPLSTRTTLLGTITSILSSVNARTALSHPVMKVLHKKLQAHILERLVARSAEQRLKATAAASEALGGYGLAEFGGQIIEMVNGLTAVRRADWEAKGQWLEEVAKDVEKMTHHVR
ncbi:hypothetical protein MMC06_001794, partial [Schaereria dolodes]|nr:hypothetical protein [Schaereria dolodes]